jgi:hypothetical protein
MELEAEQSETETAGLGFSGVSGSMFVLTV